jgi:small conductance mechanosensitive channel
VVILQEIQNSSIKITIRAWASVDNYWDIYWELNKILKAKIEAAGLHVPAPRQDVRIVG